MKLDHDAVRLLHLPRRVQRTCDLAVQVQIRHPQFLRMTKMLQRRCQVARGQAESLPGGGIGRL